MNEANGVLRLPQVELLCGLSRSSIYRLEAEGQFPRRVRLTARSVAWPRDAVVKWLESRPTAHADGSACGTAPAWAPRSGAR
jgi:prophage regulatory protein